MDWQTLINIGGSALLALFGWFARELWDIVKQIKQDLQALEVKIADEYVKKVDINARFDKIDAQFAMVDARFTAQKSELRDAIRRDMYGFAAFLIFATTATIGAINTFVI